MRKETIFCNECEKQIKDESFFTVNPGKRKKVGVTMALTAGGRNRIHLGNNAQMRISLDTYIIGEDGTNQCGQVDLHWRCLTKIVKAKLHHWVTNVWNDDEELSNG